MWTKTILRIAPLFGLLALGACSGGGEGEESEAPTPVTTTNYTVDFSAAHVISANAVPATVTATASLRSASGDGITATGTVTVSGTTATAVTINIGYAGENGPVAVTLSDSGGGSWTIPSGIELSTNELRRLDSTGYYVRIQSADGELRGQILPPGWAVGTISLDAASVVPTSTSTGSAKGGFAINPSIGTYYARITISGVPDATSAGIRDAIAGGVGDLILPFEESMTASGVWGSRDINNANANDLLTATGLELLGNGQLYFSVESASNPVGALRGQIIDETVAVYDSELTSSEVVTGGAPVVSTAAGNATTTWVAGLSRFGVAVNTDIPDAISVGVYEGVPGQNGTLVFALMQNAVVTGNWQLQPTDISAEQASTLEDGGFYVSIVTAGNPMGELRGQLTAASAEATVAFIGPGGGQLSTPDGVTLSVPAGALTETLPISARRLQGTRALPAPFVDPVVPLHAAVEFGPPGTEFALPVTLSIDLEKAAPAAAEQRLLVHDPETGTWKETEFIVTASIDGASATADLTHFSDYAITFSESGSEGYFGPADLLTESREAIFERIRNRFNILFLQDSVARPYDPGTVPSDDPNHPGLDLFNCYAPRAASFVLDTNDSSDSEIEPALVETLGNPDGATFYMAFSRQYEESYLTTAGDDEVTVEISALYQVFVYYFAVSPNVDIEASPNEVWVTDQSELSARVLCGETGFKDQSIELTLDNEALGTVTPSEGSTDENGIFTATFSADATNGGTTEITATTDWSEAVSDQSLMPTGSTDVDVFSLTGNWSGAGSETISGCEDPEEDGTFSGAANYAITQNGLNISGSGSWTSFSGFVTPQPNGAFSLVGSFTDSEDGNSSGSFSGSGSAADGILNISWSGSDPDGTCSYSGSGTAARQ